MDTRRRRTTVLVVVLAVVAAAVVAFSVSDRLASVRTPTPPAIATPAATPSEPIYDYGEAIREHLMVPTDLDNDADGEPDLVSIDIVRPSTSTKVPVILESSPYYFTLGRGAESQRKKIGPDGTVESMPLFYDNYFVPRGYAFVAMDNPGTGRSTGCMDMWGPEDVGAAVAVVEFLAGNRSAVDSDGNEVSATQWSSGSVGMIGKSYDATIANAVAATGVDGLDTVVSIAGISDPYDYTRFGGIIRYPDYERGFIGEMTSRPDQCAAVTDAIPAAADETGGSYTKFWADRNIVDQTDGTTASVFLVHGLTDWNVLPTQFSDYWQALEAADVPRKLWLSQSGHVDPFDLRRDVWVTTLHEWFDHWLLKVPTDIMGDPAVDLETAPGVWSTQPQWPAAQADQVDLALSGPDAAMTITTAGGVDTAQITDDKTADPDALISAPDTPSQHRLAFVGSDLASPLRISGVPTVKVRLRASAAPAQLSFWLMDYGAADRIDPPDANGVTLGSDKDCLGESIPTDSACYLDATVPTAQTPYGVLARGWIDLAHRDDLAKPTTYTPDEWLDVSLDLTPVDTALLAGHRLGLVIASSDPASVTPYDQPVTIQLDVTTGSLSVPIID